MNSPDPNRISVRVEVDIPPGLLQPGIRPQDPRAFQQEPLPPLEPAFRKIPDDNDSHPVRPRPDSGLGTICAEQVFGQEHEQVLAFVYPVSHFPSSPGPFYPPPAGAKHGVTTDGGFTWHWNDGNSNAVEGADHSASGVPNLLAVWRKKPLLPLVFGPTTPFIGVTGTDTPCGTGSGTGMLPMLGGKLFPAVWCASFEKFPDALGVFNAMWALRQAPGSPVPTWNNGGDGVKSAKVQLTLEKNVWELVLTLGPIKVVYSTPVRGGTFGPIAFPAAQADLPKLGRVSLPPVRVVAI